MKRLLDRQIATSTAATPRPSCTLPPGVAWNGFVLPMVPSADWPASLVLEHGIDRLVREALSAGRSVQEISSRVAALAQSLAMPLTDAELTHRVHAQLLANT